jgi:hypothetical protein
MLLFEFKIHSEVGEDDIVISKILRWIKKIKKKNYLIRLHRRYFASVIIRKIISHF